VALGNAMTPHPSRSHAAAKARRYRYELPASAVCVALARHRARAQLALWAFDDDTCDAVVLVISELVTNAIIHTSSESVVCELRDGADTLRIEVHDQGRGGLIPGARRASEAECGRGLLLVEELSAAWGVEDTPLGTRAVWAEVSHAVDPR
jgi:anti-sigma regulatory factor (Ser/Thr protein kinase)